MEILIIINGIENYASKPEIHSMIVLIQLKMETNTDVQTNSTPMRCGVHLNLEEYTLNKGTKKRLTRKFMIQNGLSKLT